MNRRRYRLVFNRARGQVMAVAETARAGGGTGDAAPVRVAVAGLLLCTTFAHAQLSVDPGAPAGQRPTMLSAGNGVPLVNIQTPSAAGVSRNTYSQFDVQAQGVILNNARVNAQTQLGGWVAGNPWLAAGSARVILNEVNSANPSRLGGYLEIAGDRAQVVIANPAGITCNGCGFINASRATLSTGTPVVNGGSLDGYVVERGVITVEGAGLDASQVDHSDLIARAVQINAGLWANQLKVTSGANQVDADNSQATPIAGSGGAPAYALDVAQLGGMYAGRITLIGTEAGLGMRNAGTIGASAGDIVVSADGRLDNSGTLAARDTLGVTAAQLANRGLIDGQDTFIDAPTLDNLGSGRIYGDHVALRATALSNRGETVAGVSQAPVIAARDRLDIGAVSLDNREHALLFSAGNLAIGGDLDAAHHASGQADSLANASATIEALGDLTLSARSIVNRDEHFTTEVVDGGSQRIVEYQQSGSPERYPSEQIAGFGSHGDDILCVNLPTGCIEDHLRYDYTRASTETRILNSDPARILAGGAMDLAADSLLNDAGQIVAGGALRGAIGSLTNREIAGERTVSDSGSATHYYRIQQKGRDDQGADTTPYTPAPSIQAISLAPSVYQGDGAPAGTQFSLPDNRLYSINPDPAAHYLIETDPQFADYRTWLGSDTLLAALGIDPASRARLGDGYYEQRLIREQVVQLTGRRFLADYRDDESQYRALLDNAATAARGLYLIPGIALSTEQVAQLTSDIVWLVEQTVTLPDGQTRQVLVPRVYARVLAGDLDGSGALLAGAEIDLGLIGTLANSGAINAVGNLRIYADAIANQGGRLHADDLALTAVNDLSQIGGQLHGGSRLSLLAGRDLALASTTRSQGNAQGSRSNIDRVATLYGGSYGLVLAAGRDLDLDAVQASSAGATTIAAGHDLSLGTVGESASNRLVWNAANTRSDSSRTDIGSTIQAQGDIRLQAGNDLNARAAGVASAQGALVAAAGNDINLTAGEANRGLDEAHQHSSRGFLSRKTTTTRDTLDETTTLGTTFSGNTVDLQAGRDLTLSGSQTVSDAGTRLDAQHELRIQAASDTSVESHFRDVKQSGLLGNGGGIGFTLGSRQQSSDSRTTATQAAASTVGATQGDVNLQAGQTYSQVGSDVLAPQGDIAIAAQRIAITEARETRQTSTETRFKQSGLSVAITNPVISATQTARQMNQASKQSSDPRMRALAAATTALAAKNAYDAVQANPSQAGGINLSISIGVSQSQSSSVESSDSARGSSAQAGGDIDLRAAGAGKDSDLTIQGGNVKAGHDLTLQADNAINLLAAQNTASQTSSNKNSSASIGISIGTNGLLLTVGASGGRGKADGADLTHGNTHVEAGNRLSLDSGGDTTLKGAIAKAEQITADIGGDLNIESLQDTSRYASKQQSLGGSISVGYGKVGGSLNASKSSIASDYASVTEQTGFQAGDGGFQVNVSGHTDLTGAVIASSDKAVEAGRNTFTSASLASRDIQNKAEYKADSVSLAAGVGSQLAGSSGFGAGLGKDSGQAQSTSRAGISGLAGHAEVRSGDAETGIKPLFDQDKVQGEINAQTAITQAFGREAPKAVAAYAASKARELLAASNTAEAEKWQEGGVYRIALHTALGAMSGGLSGAVGAATVAATVPLLDQLQTQVQNNLEIAGLTPEAAKLVSQALAQITAVGLGAAVGGGTGAAMAFNVDVNNRQLHYDNFLNKRKACQGSSSKECQTLQRMGGVRSEILDFLSLPEANVAANFGADGKVVSYTILDRSHGNAPLLIMEPAEFMAYREAPLATRGNYLLAPQWSLDAGSSIVYAGIGNTDKALEHFGYAASSPEYWAGVVLGGTVGLASKAPGSVVTGPLATMEAEGVGAKGVSGIATETNQAFFWSGLGRGGDKIATEIATTRGGTTLEQTIKARGIDMPVWDASNPTSVQAWQNASRAYAEGAGGTVRAVIGDSLRPGNIWETTELPALKANPNVTKIIKIHPTTGTETVIFNRSGL